MYNKFYNLILEDMVDYINGEPRRLSGASRAMLSLNRKRINKNTSIGLAVKLGDKQEDLKKVIPQKKNRIKSRIKFNRNLASGEKGQEGKKKDRAFRKYMADGIRGLRKIKPIDEGTTTGGDPTYTAIRMGRAERKNNLRDYSDKRVNKIAAKVTKKHSKHLPKGVRSKAAKETYNRFMDAYHRSNNFETWQIKT